MPRWSSLPTRESLIGSTSRVVFGSILSVSVAMSITWAGSGEYARPDPLAETGWLAQHLNDSAIRIVDMRSEEAYRKGHIPGAVNLGWQALKDADNQLYVIPPERFSALMSQMGASNSTTVVGYDDQGGLSPTRLWWVLDYYGHRNSEILNGGWNKWLQEKRPVGTQVSRPAPTQFDVQIDAQKICLMKDLLGGLKGPNLVIIDTRSPAEYSGFDVRAMRGGHIPGAINIDWVRNITKDEFKTFKPASEMRKMYEAAGVTPDKDIIVLCQIGVRATHTIFALTLLGYNQLRNFEGSWQEWGNRPDLPIAR